MHTPQVCTTPDPTGVKILLARVSRVRVRVRVRVKVRVRVTVRVRVVVLASGNPQGRGAQRTKF